MKSIDYAAYQSLDLGDAKPTSVPMETIEVEVSAGQIVGKYADAFIDEAWRRNPRRMEQIGLTPEEVHAYTEFLLWERINVVEQDCPDFRKLKSLYVPGFIHYVLSQVGEVIIRDRGLTLKPVFVKSTLLAREDQPEEEVSEDLPPEKENPQAKRAREAGVITLDEAYDISDKIGALEEDLEIYQDAMPRSIYGDVDVMSTALIAHYMKSLKEVSKIASTYVAAFLNFTLRKQSAFQVLYRVEYDDVNYIATALTTQRCLFGR